MAFKVQVGPPQIAIHQGQTVLITDEDGQINWPSEKGLYFLDTRIVSSWAVYANGEPWELLNGGAISYYASRIFLTNRSFLTEDGAIPPRALGLTLSRSISGGMHEDLDVINNSMKPVKFQLEIALRCDFADIFEVKSGRIVRRGRIATEWSDDRQQLRTTYRNADFSRAVTISPARSSARRYTPTGGSASRWPSNRVKHGIAAYSMRWQTASKHFSPPIDCIGTATSRATPRRWRTG